MPLAFAALASSASASLQLRRKAIATPEDIEYLDEVMDMHGMTMNATSIVDVALNNYGTLFAAISAARLGDALASEGPFTLFAPDDKAFVEDLGNETLAKLLDPKWIHHLSDVLSYHVVMGETLMAEDLLSGDVLEMGNGELANITTGAPRYSINGHAIVEADQKADNGVVHGIGSVLLPGWVGVDVVSAAASLPDVFGTLSTAIELAGFTQLLNGKGPFTVFAPTNQAFAQLDNATLEFALGPNGTYFLADLLAYHVYPGIVTMEGIADIIDAGKGERFTMSNGFFADLTMATMDTNTTDLAMMNDTAMDMDGIDVVASAFEAPVVEYRINDILISSGDILVDNGIIHVIDEVNVPQMVRA